MFTLATIIQHSFVSPSLGNQKRKEIKEIQTGKISKMVVVYDMIMRELMLR